MYNAFMAEQLSSIKHVVHFMTSGKVKLSRQDAKFLSNVDQIIRNQATITTNQVGLFNHILRKYERQVSKHGLDVNVLIALPWNISIVESSKQFTQARVTLADGLILLKCPYNNKFINALREHRYSDQIIWDKLSKQYKATFSNTVLKIVIELVFKHYEHVQCCDKTISIMDELVSYETAKYWNPTLVKVGENYIIAGINERLDNLLKNIVLSDDPIILHHLSKHAINIDEAIPKTPLQKFAATYNVHIDYSDIEQLVEWLVELKCDGIYTEERYSEDKKWIKLRSILHKSPIPVHEVSIWKKTPSPKDMGYRNPVVITAMLGETHQQLYPISKKISMVNNKPIKLI